MLNETRIVENKFIEIGAVEPIVYLIIWHLRERLKVPGNRLCMTACRRRGVTTGALLSHGGLGCATDDSHILQGPNYVTLLGVYRLRLSNTSRRTFIEN